MTTFAQKYRKKPQATTPVLPLALRDALQVSSQTIQKPSLSVSFGSKYRKDSPYYSPRPSIPTKILELQKQAKIAEAEAQKSSSLWGLLKETGKQIVGLGERKLFGGAVTEPRKIIEAYKPVGEYVKGIIKEPREAAKGVVGVAIFEPIQFAQRILQPSVEQHEIFAEPTTPEGKKARAVGEFLGWAIPYTVVSKSVKAGLTAVKLAPTIAKYIPVIADTAGFVGTGQILHEEKEGSRLKQLRNDVILLGIFKAVGFGIRALRGKEINKAIDNVADEFKKVSVTGGDLKPVEVKIKVINQAIKTETGKIPKEHLQEDILTGGRAILAKEPIIPKELEPLTQATKGIKEVLPVEEMKPSKIAQSIEAKAVEDKLTTGFSEIAGYEPLIIKEDAQASVNLIASDLAKARRVIRGEESLPKDIRNGVSLITAMEEHLKKTRNPELAYELANSPLVSETSVAGQTLRVAKERMPDSATMKLQELKRFREEQVAKTTKKTKQSIAKELAEGTKAKLDLSMEKLNKFIDEIIC